MSDAQTRPNVFLKGRIVVGSPQTCAHLMEMAAARRSDNPGPPSRDEMYAVWNAETDDGGPSLQAKYMRFLEDHSFVTVNLECEAEVHELLLDIMAMS